MAKLVMSRQWETPRGAPRTVPSSSGKRNTVLIATLTERPFCCYMGGGELRVELFTGKRYVPDSEKSRRGFVEYASSHARQLVPPEPGLQSEGLFRAWEAKVGNVTGVPVGRWVMGGFECILEECGEGLRIKKPATARPASGGGTSCPRPAKGHQR